MTAKKKSESNTDNKNLTEEQNKVVKDQLKKNENKIETSDMQDTSLEKGSGKTGDRGVIILGAGMLIIGAVMLLGRVIGFSISDYLWPFILIMPGLVILLSALASESQTSEGVAVLGGILTSLGALFLFQQITGWWASWAYAWALIAPFSVGVSQVLYGNRKNRDTIAATGKRLVRLGLVMFAVGFIFFEVILGVSGYGLARLNLPVFPVVLIFVGIMVLVRALVAKK